MSVFIGNVCRITDTVKCPRRYTHDCKLCLYLGQYNQYDLYFHASRYPILTARYGNEEAAFMTAFATARDFKAVTPLLAARQLAREYRLMR